MLIDKVEKALAEAKEQRAETNYICMTEDNYNKLTKEIIENKSIDSNECLLIAGRKFETNKLEDGSIEIHLLD
ncbi:MAG: hypothetical protein K0S61_681 [Anaerocolumna sp.]|jgi:hypothetical protein|nr:hypothetical protein [Anaerocolumna sp.]